MPSIGIFVKNLTSGGAEKQAVLLARVLAPDVKVHFIVFNGDKVHEKYLLRLKEDNRIAVALFRGGHLSRFRQFVSYLKANKISMIFSYLAAANLYACIAGRLTETKVYTGLRNVDLPWKKRLVDKQLTNHFASGTIVNCHTGKDNFVRHGFRKDKLMVIPNGFENIQDYKGKAQGDMVRFITVGRFHPQKDYATAIKAFATLHKSFNNTEYYIVGYGEEEQGDHGVDRICKACTRTGHEAGLHPFAQRLLDYHYGDRPQWHRSAYSYTESLDYVQYHTSNQTKSGKNTHRCFCRRQKY